MLSFARCMLAVFATAFSVVASFQLLRGEWLRLVIGKRNLPQQESADQRESDRMTARNAAFVSLSFSASVASLLIAEIAQEAGALLLFQAFTLVCDAATVAFLVTVVLLYVRLGRASNVTRAMFDAGNMRVTVFVLVQVVAMTAISLLFSL